MCDEDQMTISVNGERRTVRAGISVAELLRSMSIRQQWVVCEHNGAIVRSERFGAVTLRDSDTLEIISFVGGG